MRLGQALHCTCEPSSSPARTTSIPTCRRTIRSASTTSRSTSTAGSTCPTGSRVGIERAHIEEDTGKNTHVGGGGRIHDADYSLIDYNRAGVPLVEIVSRPDLRSAEQARDVRRASCARILVATGVSDAKMEEGSMRVDANVSVRRAGDDALGTRCEIKNLNSLRSLGRAIEYEARRQVDLIDAGERVAPGDPPLGRGRGPHPHRPLARKRPRTTATSPSPTWCRSSPTTTCIGRARRGAAAAAGRSPRPPRRTRARRRPTAVAIAVERGLDDLALAAIDAGGDPARVLNHVEHNLAVEGRGAVDPDGARGARRAWRSTARSPRRRPRRCSPRWSNGATDPCRRRGGQGLRGDGRDGARSRSSTTSSPPTPTTWEKFVGGDDKAGGLLHRPGDEGHQRQSRRQGRHRDIAASARGPPRGRPLR